MPTATAIEGASLYNLGPLTSTWSAPSSCITNGFNTALAYFISPKEGAFVDAFADCYEDAWEPMGECYPDGDEFMSIITSNEERATPTYEGHLFHSPASECPEGWYTAGAATMGPDGDMAQRTGSLFEPFETITSADIYFKPYPLRFADGLDAGETAVWCCPSDYVVDPLGGNCYSTIEPSTFTVTALCRENIANSLVEQTQTFTVDGEPFTREDFLTWEGDRSYSTEILETTMGPVQLESADLTPVVFYPMITLAYKDEEEENEGSNDGNGGGNGGGNDGGNGEGGEGSGDNAATGLMDAGVMAAVLGAAGVLGAALIL